MSKKVYYLKKIYFDTLLSDPEFERNINRPYYVIKNIEYKGKNISVAIPLRSNINKKFQSKPNEYIATIPTSHTLSGKGNIAGWHFTKAIPVSFDVLISSVPNDVNLNMALDIADNYKKEEFINKTKQLVSTLSEGNNVFGSVNFDKALENLDKIISEQKQLHNAQKLVVESIEATKKGEKSLCVSESKEEIKKLFK